MTAGRGIQGDRLQAMVRIALKAEEAGLDVFATGGHHADHPRTTPVKIAED